MIDRVAARLGRTLYEVPVGFKWFVDGLHRRLARLRRRGERGRVVPAARRHRLDDRQGRHHVPALLSAEITARTGGIPASCIATSTDALGEPVYRARRRAGDAAQQAQLLAAIAPARRSARPSWPASTSSDVSTPRPATARRSAASRSARRTAGSRRARQAPSAVQDLRGELPRRRPPEAHLRGGAAHRRRRDRAALTTRVRRLRVRRRGAVRVAVSATVHHRDQQRLARAHLVDGAGVEHAGRLPSARRDRSARAGSCGGPTRRCTPTAARPSARDRRAPRSAGRARWSARRAGPASCRPPRARRARGTAAGAARRTGSRRARRSRCRGRPAASRSTSSNALTDSAVARRSASARRAERDVLAHGRLEHVGVLRDERRERRERLDVRMQDAVDRHASVVRVVEAGDDAHQRALAGAARSDQRDALAALERERRAVDALAAVRRVV